MHETSPDSRANRQTVTDTMQRPLRDLRISVTDRCNFRCVYCMPKEVFGPDFQFMPRPELLTYEEIERLAKIFVSLGVEKIRLTGGEPLVRRQIERLIERLAAIPGLRDLAMTTNGSLLSVAKAKSLRDAGLRRVTISLDALDDAVFMAMNDVHYPVGRVLDAIDAAEAAGLSPVKINMVVRRGLNDDQIVPMAQYFRGSGHIVRFIEYMDVGNSNGWRLQDVVGADEILSRIDAHWPLVAVQPERLGEVATRYRYRDGSGEIGVIASVTRPFCQSCTRVRLSAEGRLYTCLFGHIGKDVRELLRSDTDNDAIAKFLQSVWIHRDDRYSELRTAGTQNLPKKVEMFHIGG